MSPTIFVLAFLVCTAAAKPALLSKPALPLASSVFDDTVYGWEEVAQSDASVAAPSLDVWLDSNNVTLYGVRIARFSHGLYSDVQLRGVVATALLGPVLTALVTLGLLPVLSRELASFLGGGGDGTSYMAGTGTGVMTGTRGRTDDTGSGGSGTGSATMPSSAGFALDGGRLIIDSTMTMVDEDIGGVGGVRHIS